LSQGDRLKIATEAFNLTLKLLGDTIKALKGNQECIGTSQPPLCLPQPDQALQERSGHREGKRPAACPRETTPSGKPGDVEVVAECCCSALQYLRKSDAGTTRSGATKNVGLENAALILLDRSISLNLATHAVRQLSDIQHVYWRSYSEETIPLETSIAGLLLGRPDAADDNSIFGFTTSMQSQALRLALLLGPKCISPELVKSLGPDTAGSPAWITIQGLSRGRLKPEQAGLQLRTIALAAARMYTTAIKSSSEKPSPEVLFDLFFLSLRVKFESWTHLGVTPDPAADVWRPFHHALKKLSIHTSGLGVSYKQVLHSIVPIRGLIDAAGCAPDIPLELAETLMDTVEDSDEHARLVSILEENIPESGGRHLVLRCQITTSLLKDVSHNLPKALSSVKILERTLDERTAISQGELAKFLVHLAQLRKVTAALIMADPATNRAPGHEGGPQILQIGLVRLTYASFRFLKRHMTTALTQSADDSPTNIQQAFLITFMKIIDTVLSTDRCAVTQTPELAQMLWETLKDCSVAIDDLQTSYNSAHAQSPVETQRTQLRIRMSQLFWSRYLAAVKAGKPPLEQAVVLELSLQGLLELPIPDQRAAYPALKFEKLGHCFLAANNFVMATSAFRNAISASIRQGVLGDIVESLLSGPLRCAWSEQDPNQKAFGKVLATYAKTLLDHPPRDGVNECFYDDQSLPAIQRAALIEKQMLSIFELDLGDRQYSACTRMVEMLHQLLSQPEYQVYMSRSVSQLLGFCLRRRTAASTFPVNTAIVQGLLGWENAANENVFLREFGRELRSLLCLQHGFFNGSITHQVLAKAVEHLSDIAHSCATLEQTHVLCDDVGAHVLPLLLAVDYASMGEDDRTALAALGTLEHLGNLGIDAPGLCMTSILVRKSNILLRLRDAQSAGISLARANKALGDARMEPLSEVELALSYSEYHLQVLNLEECLHCLLRAKRAWEDQDMSTRLASTKAKLKGQSLLCRAAYLASQVAYKQHQLLEAIVFARQSAKIASSIWSSIDNLWASAARSESTAPADSEMHNVSAEFSKLDVSNEPFLQFKANTVFCAPYVSLCFDVFKHTAFLISHCGIYQDAATFYDQALKISRRTSRSTDEAIVLSELSVLYARAGQVAKAREVIRDPLQSNVLCASGYHHALASVNRGEAYLVMEDLTAAHRWLLEAKQHRACNVNCSDDPVARRIPKGRMIKPTVKKPVRQGTAKRQKDNELGQPTTSCVSSSTLEFKDVDVRISALETRLKLLEHGAGATTVSSNAIGRNDDEDSRMSIAVALNLVRAGLKLLSDDPVHGVLAETAVALPVRYRSARKSGRVSFVQGAALVNAKTRVTKQKQENSTFRNGSALLLQAHDILQRLNDSRPNRLSSELVHTCYKVMTQITLLSTALNQPLVPSSLDLVLDIARPLDLARLREDYVTLGELSATRRTKMYEWPSANVIINGRSVDSKPVKELDLALLPASWSVVCLELNEDKNELFMARLRREASPFVVRIPLARPDPSDGETDGLDLTSAKIEMQEIITRANATAHDARGSSADKSVRGAWFAQRQALDQQLSTLLDNIENVWFGGFRGLLCTSHQDERQFSGFGQRLNSTLNRHLPSRRKTSRPGDSTVHLHDHVLELFIGLGHPRDADLEDAVTDLLYFVIDILQFNGERNAYDEIDFDAMLIEVLDALHAYHDATPLAGDKHDHLILVLDKELQLFPWESLPCLRGHAASRMPSLGAIWERLGTMSERSPTSEAYMIRKTNGAYILNPSSDLKSTQETFAQLFQNQLRGYKAIVNRAPETGEFETALQEHDLMLYFGHGGAGQYIRPRVIRKMDKCATTLLMGCSSAKLSECGVYEPSGMPLSYLSGGCPALVGTLWDVTDRDIDRFALQLMENWGLLNVADGSGGRNPKKSSKSKTERCQKRGPVSLDQAVADGRDACLLKYLNGAAPVMYGVPVILD
jgi:separase